MTKIMNYIKELLEVNIPYQFVPFTGLEIIKKYCKELGLQDPQSLAGNIVIGNLEKAELTLTAHLDELSFGFQKISKNGAWLAPYHKFINSTKESELSIIGIRNKTVKLIGNGVLITKDSKPFCKTNKIIYPGDRAVYKYKTEISNDLITGKAIDDRVGVLITLLAAKELKDKNFPVSVVLTDGEEQIPEGYFSRTFPQILKFLNKDCLVCFVDGTYREDLEPLGYTKAPAKALVIPHSSYGKGYVVPPVTFAWLRDEIIPLAKKSGIKVDICEGYRSRGDEWGMVTNPVFGKEFESFFVDFGAWGELSHEVPLTIDTKSIVNCVEFIKFVFENKIR